MSALERNVYGVIKEMVKRYALLHVAHTVRYAESPEELHLRISFGDHENIPFKTFERIFRPDDNDIRAHNWLPAIQNQIWKWAESYVTRNDHLNFEIEFVF